MKYRLVVALPAIAVVLLVAGAFAVPVDAREVFLRAELEVVKALSAVGAAAAAFTFSRGDHLRRAWMYGAVCMALLVLHDITLLPFDWERLPIPLINVQAAVVAVANVYGVAGTWLLARAWRVAGLELPGSRTTKALVLLVAIALAIVLAGPATWSGLEAVVAGDPSGWNRLAGSLPDIIQLPMIAPLALTALALRGGLLGWCWGLIAATYLGWLAYDAVAFLGPSVVDPWVARVLAEAARTIACVSWFSAGITQRLIVLDARRRATESP